jgi:hypothetical protein
MLVPSRHQYALGAAAVLLSCAASATRAVAQTQPPPAPGSTAAGPVATSAPAGKPGVVDEKEAQRHQSVGLRLYKEGQLEGALVEFREAYRLGSLPAAQQYAAQTLRGLKRHAAAYAAYEVLLAKHSSQLSANDLVSARVALEDLRLVTGELTIAANQPDADVSIDGASVGKVPLAGPIRLDAGNHKLKVAKAGFEPFEVDVAIVPQAKAKSDVHLVAIVTTGHVSVREQNAAPDVHVFVDGSDMGVAPWEGDLTPGSHTLEARGSTIASESRAVDVPLKGKIEVVLLATAVSGTLSVVAKPATAEIAIDGKPTGIGKFDGALPAGTHQVTVTNKGYVTYQVPVLVERGKTVALPVELAAVPVVAEAPKPPPPPPLPSLEGMYARVGLFGVIPSATPRVSCLDTEVNCGAKTVLDIGLGVDFRLGYSFGYLSVEGTVAALGTFKIRDLSYDGASDPTQINQTRVDDTVQREEVYHYLGAAGFGGVGVRGATQGEFARFSLGASLGLVYKYVNVGRETAGVIVDSFNAGASYVAPGCLLDGSVLLGSTPGTRLTLGFIAWISLPRSDVYTADAGDRYPDFLASKITGLPPGLPVPAQLAFRTPAYQVASKGVEYFLGPRFGLEFGR